MILYVFFSYIVANKLSLSLSLSTVPGPHILLHADRMEDKMIIKVSLVRIKEAVHSGLQNSLDNSSNYTTGNK